MITPFKKTEKQALATKMAGDPFLKHFMLYGGSRSGKTFDHVRRIYIRACKTRSRHLILRLNFNHVKTSVWHETMPNVEKICFPELTVKENKSDYYKLLPNGSEIWIAGLDQKDRTEKILGKEYSTIYFNECSQLDYNAVLMAHTRLAEKNNLRKVCYYDMNPPSKAHWAYWLWERHFDPLAEQPVEPREYQSLLMNPADNLENLDPEYLKILEKMPEAERNRFLLGLFAEVDEGLAYYAFDRDRHIDEVTRQPGTVFLAQDFNVDPMAGIIFQVVGNQFHVIDEVFLRNSDTYRLCHNLVSRGYGGVQVIPDSTAKNRKTSGKSDINILREHGFTVVNTKNPYVRDRVNNINRLFTADKIKINPRCKKLINDLERVSFKDGKLDQKTDTLLTHVSDALGYGCWKLDPIGKINTPVTMGSR